MYELGVCQGGSVPDCWGYQASIFRFFILSSFSVKMLLRLFRVAVGCKCLKVFCYAQQCLLMGSPTDSCHTNLCPFVQILLCWGWVNINKITAGLCDQGFVDLFPYLVFWNFVFSWVCWVSVCHLNIGHWSHSWDHAGASARKIFGYPFSKHLFKLCLQLYVYLFEA